MGDALPLIVLLANLALVLLGLPWLASRVRRRGVGGSVMGPFQEIWDPAVHRARTQIEIQHESPAPAPSPGDPPRLGIPAALDRGSAAKPQRARFSRSRGAPKPH